MEFFFHIKIEKIDGKNESHLFFSFDKT